MTLKKVWAADVMVESDTLAIFGKDEIRKLNLRFSLPEFSLKSVEYSLHLYTDIGDEIAMSSSRGLKPLTQSEFEKLKSALN